MALTMIRIYINRSFYKPIHKGDMFLRAIIKGHSLQNIFYQQLDFVTF